MKDRNITATFIGQDGSMDLKHGKKYNIAIYHRFGEYVVEWFNNRCPYSTMKALLRNWNLESDTKGR